MNEYNNNDLYDLIQNIQSKLNSDQSENQNTNVNQNIDFSSIISNLSGSNNSENNTNNGDFDMNTILKLQKIFSALNRNDPKKNLLLSLKPFLRKSRQDKINEYITLLSISDALGIFSSRGENKDE